jgi:hypothetical protein
MILDDYLVIPKVKFYHQTNFGRGHKHILENKTKIIEILNFKINFFENPTKIVLSIEDININYYLLRPSNTFISVIIHGEYGLNIPFLHNINNNHIIQLMPECFTGGITNQHYHLFTFSGELIYNISNINDYISRTILFL